MKPFWLFFLFMPFSFAPANTLDPIDKTIELIKKAEIHELAKSFSSNVDLTVMGDGDIYSKDRAEVILSDFFKRNPPRSANVLHRITSNPNYRFGVFILTTDNGAYRISFSLKNNNNHFELNELRIEAEK